MDPVRHLRFSLAALVSIIAIGTFGYSIVEDWSLFDSPNSVLITLGEIPAIEKLEKFAGGSQQ